MLTALIHARSTPDALAVTLASLVPAVADGLMSHAVVVMPEAREACGRIADAMGATVLVAATDPWSAAARSARGDWVILLDAGETPEQGWITAIERHLMQHAGHSQRPALLPPAGAFGTFIARLNASLTTGTPRSGVIAPRLTVAEGRLTARPVILGVGRQRLPG